MLFLLLAAVVPSGTSFTCTPTHVWDGDGPIWCAEGPKIRLSGIAAREMDGLCRSNQPCPAASAVAARDHLARLLGGARGVAPRGHLVVRGPRLQCRSVGGGKGERTAAWCSAPNVGDLSCAMVKSGTVLRWKRYWKDFRC